MNNDSTEILEKAVIGCVLANPYNLNLLPNLDTGQFTNYRAKATWDAIRNLETANTLIDLATVSDELGRAGKLDGVGFAYLGECQYDVPSLDHAIEYAHLLRDKALRVRLLESIGDVVRAAQNGASGSDVLEMLHIALGEIQAKQDDSSKTIQKVITDRLRQIDLMLTEKSKGGRSLTGYETGVSKLDGFIGGWQPGIVSIVAARPGMGKSSFGLATADAATALGHGVHVFSLEDTEAAYADRTVARRSGVTAELIRSGGMIRSDYSNVVNAVSRMGTRPWLLDSRSGVSAQEIVRSVRRNVGENKTKVVIVDYIQLLSKRSGMTSHESLGESITTLADAAKQDGIAYVVMSQLNRGVEQRSDKRPQLSDLRESGSLEERAKCVVALYRGAYYGEPQDGIDYDAKREPRPSPDVFEKTIQLVILKNSNGQTGTVFAEWHGPTTTVR